MINRGPYRERPSLEWAASPYTCAQFPVIPNQPGGNIVLPRQQIHQFRKFEYHEFLLCPGICSFDALAILIQKELELDASMLGVPFQEGW